VIRLARHTLVGVVLSTLAIGVGCRADTGAAPLPGVIDAIALAQDKLTLGVGSSAPLAVTVRDAEGNALSAAVVYWSSSDPAVATVSPNGVVTAVSVGNAHIAATAQGKSAVAKLTVAPRAPAQVGRVVVSPLTATIKWSGPSDRTVQLTATAYATATGATVVPNATFTWTTSKASVATVSPAGLVTAVSDGLVTITATSGNASGIAIVTSIKK
jgi:uncharacterized protein YjdB